MNYVYAAISATCAAMATGDLLVGLAVLWGLLSIAAGVDRLREVVEKLD